MSWSCGLTIFDIWRTTKYCTYYYYYYYYTVGLNWLIPSLPVLFIFSSQICLKTFTRRPHLEEHMILHSQDRPFKCTFCDEYFKSRFARLKHQEKYHLGESVEWLQLNLVWLIRDIHLLLSVLSGFFFGWWLLSHISLDSEFKFIGH